MEKQTALIQQTEARYPGLLLCLVSAELPVCLGPPLPLEATVSYFLVDDPFEKFEHPVGLGFLPVEDFPCLVA